MRAGRCASGRRRCVLSGEVVRGGAHAGAAVVGGGSDGAHQWCGEFTGARVSASELLTAESWGVGSWRERLTRDQYGDVRQVAGTELSRLGYT